MNYEQVLREADHAYRAGQLDQAAALAERVRARKPKNLVASDLLAVIASIRGDLEEAERHDRRCVQLAPHEPRFRHRLGQTLAELGRTEEALACFEQALSKRPDEIGFITSQAVALERCGRSDEAAELIARIIEKGNETASMIALQGRLEIQAGRPEQAASYLAERLENATINAAQRQLLFYTLAKAHDKAGDYDAAFEACTAANAIDAPPFDPDAWIARVDALIETFSPERIGALARGRDTSALPVFVAGMPRSGTTLVEQILAAHPKVHAAGERIDIARVADGLQVQLGSMRPYPECLFDLDDKACARIAANLLHTFRRLERGAARMVNKSLDNVMHAGFEAMLFPGARVVTCRRNPLDTCVSCFMNPLLPVRFRFVTDLRNLGLAYRQHERLVAHWQQVLPEVLGVPVHEVVYETMVDDQDAMSRQLIEFCGLDWDDACLRFYEADRTVMTLSYDQVNKPIYRGSVERWRRYEKHLGPLIESLEEHASSSTGC